MIKYVKKLDSDYKIHYPINQIETLPDYLQLAIDEFQEELNWEKMWSVEDAEKRLKDGWKFNTVELDSWGRNTIFGWIWLSPKQIACNLYVHKYYRNKGWGEKLILSIFNVAKQLGYDKVYSEIDEWNEVSKRLVDRLGYARLNI